MQLFTTAEAASYLRLKERKVYEMVAEGTVPCTKVTGRWLFPKADLDHWLASSVTRPEGMTRPEPLSRNAHSSSGSWLPPMIGAGSGRVMPAGRVTLEASQWSRSALGNSQRPVTLVQGTVPSATIS